MLGLFLATIQAQTFTVLHTFTGGMDGATPYGGLTWDGGANFYGTAAQGGYTGTVCFSLFFSPADGCGTVFRLHRSGSNWTFSTLYEFRGGTVDGNFPTAAVTIAPDGSLYGTTWGGYFQGQRGCEGFGNNLHYGCGIVFNLRPPSTACKTALCFWTETISFAFPGTNDGGGAGPGLGALIFDRAGNLYGTNWNAQGNVGEVTQLVPSGGSLMLGWIYVSSDNGQSDTPNVIFNGLTFDAAENLYGTSLMGPDDGQYCRFGRYYNGCGTVYQLVSTSSGWTADKLYVFTDGDDGEFPMAGLVADQAGNLYGSTSAGGAGGGGVVFELSPSDGSWVYHSIYPLPGGNAQVACLIPVGGVGKCTGPWGNLLIDAAGNLYGASYANGTYELGNVFKLTRSNDTWAYTDLYDFTGGTDGANPIGSLTLDNNGNLYGTAIHGGANGDGVVFEIAQ